MLSTELIIEKDGEEYHAYCPALKGLHICGKTVDETIKNSVDGIWLYTESLKRHQRGLLEGLHGGGNQATA